MCSGLERLFRKRNLGLFMVLTGVCLLCLAWMSDFGTACIFFATFLMGLVCADGLILWTEHLVSPCLPKGWAFLVSKGVSIVGPFFLMYFVRKYAFQKLESKRKGS